MLLRRALPGLSLIALLSLTAGAATAASPKDKQEARTLANDGKKALKDKRYADALKALQRSDELDPSPQTKLELAEALSNQGKLVEASRALHGAMDGSGSAKKIGESAKKALADLEPRIPWIKIDVRGPEAGDATMKIDGADVDASNEVPFNPGSHKASAVADGFDPAEKAFDLKEGEHKKVKLTLARTGGGGGGKTSSSGSSGGSSTPAIIAFSAAGAGVIVGSIFGYLAISSANDARKNCTADLCTPAAQPFIDSSKTDGTISTVGFVAGGVGAVVGVVLLIVSPGSSAPPPPKEKESAEIKPWIGLGQLGVSGRF